MAPRTLSMDYKLMSDREAERRLQKFSDDEISKAKKEMKKEYGRDGDDMSQEWLNWDLVDRLEKKREKEQKAKDEAPDTPKRKRANAKEPKYYYSSNSDSDDYAVSSKSSKKSSDKPAKKKTMKWFH
ncbi:hypothetical protein F5Y04DRAFT_286348 [Hypomontagnella monticulosa]|nr:hypothetical protein F5Y04DRAFT_286348 [Hypomontagnella monticulosa]